MPLLIRPLRLDDYPALAALNRLAMPGTDDTGESLQEEDESTTAVERWVAEVDGTVVGSSSWFQLPNRLHPRKFWMDGAVHPEYQRQGVGSALFDQIMASLAPKDPLSVRTFSREDYAGTLSFLGKRGFADVKRIWESYLNLKTFSFEPWAGRPERVEATGIRLRPLSELMGEPGWEEHLRELYNTIQTDIPDIDPAATVDRETFQKNYLGLASFLPEANFIALDGDQWVGLSALWKGNDEDLLNTGLTGVIGSHRRRGIALALKLRALEWAAARGVARIRTTNASTNRPMLAINEALGFDQHPAWVHLLREF